MTSSFLQLQDDEEGTIAFRFFKNRIKFVNSRKREGRTVYPHKFSVSHSAQEIHSIFNTIPNDCISETTVSVAGRVYVKRESSKHLVFFDIIDDAVKLQIVGNSKWYGDPDALSSICQSIARGDIIGVEGLPMRTKAGELSVAAKSMQILAPCLHIMPSSWDKLKNVETIQRARYLDLLVNASSREKFIVRSKILAHIRKFFENLGFNEVETPVLSNVAGGAVARPFKTNHNDLGIEMFLRIAPELYLKMLLVGGFRKVFEIGKQFRNEALDRNHNPEFTACEAYLAYSDYADMMALTEKLISGMVWDIFKKEILQHHEKGVCRQINFGAPFRRIDFMKSLEEALKVSLPLPHQLHSHASRKFLFELCSQKDLYIPDSYSAAKILDKLFSRFVEPSCLDPTFIVDYPRIMSPLAKDHRQKEGVTERFELFIAGQEICNAYTELNDPEEQRCRFEDLKEEMGDNHFIDENYLAALEYGLPPSVGWGLGIDRLVMVLTDAHSIKDIILFPTLRLTTKSKYKSL